MTVGGVGGCATGCSAAGASGGKMPWQAPSRAGAGGPGWTMGQATAGRASCATVLPPQQPACRFCRRGEIV